MATRTVELVAQSGLGEAYTLVAAGDGATLINNVGPGTLYIGDTSNIAPTDPQITPIAANGYLTVDGEEDLFGTVAQGAPTQVTLIRGGLNFFAPTSLSLLGGAAVFVQASAPTQPPTIPLNSIWFDTTNDSLQYWNGSAWITQAFAGSQLIQAGTIIASLMAAGIVVAGIVDSTTITGAIVRTAATAPLVQLDGPHDAFLLFNSSAQLVETIAPVATNDGLGDAVSPGFVAYQPGTPTTFAQLLNFALQFVESGFTADAAIGSNAQADIVLTSGTTAALVQQGALTIASNGSGGFAAFFNGALGLAEVAAPNAVSNANVGAQIFTSNISGQVRYVSDSAKGDGQAYDTGKLHLANAAQVTLTNAGQTSIIVTPKNLITTKYRITIELLISLGTTATAIIFSLTGPTVSEANIKWRASNGGGNGIFSGAMLGALGTLQLPGASTFAASTTVTVWASGDITVSAAAALTLAAEITVASATTTVPIGCTMDLEPIN